MLDQKRPADDGDLGPNKAPRTGVSDAMSMLDIRVVSRIDDLVAEGLMVHGDLDAKALGELAQFEPQDALQILDQFQHSGLENVRNKSAYLHGVMVRFRKDTAPRLDTDVDSRLERLFRSGKVKPSDLDHRVFEALNNLPPAAAVRVIDRFQTKVTEEVRNVSAFMTSLLRQEQQNLSYGSSGSTREPGGSSGYGSYRDDPGPGPAPRYDRRGPYDGYGDSYPADDPYGPPPSRGPPPPHHRLPPPQHHAHMPPSSGMYMPPGAQSLQPAPAHPQVLVISQDQLQQQQGAPVSLQSLLPQLLAAIQQQQQPAAAQSQQIVLQPQHVPAPPPAPVSMPPQPAYAQVGSVGRKSYGDEQAALGVRVAEFHGLSHFCEYVHPAPALKLQSLWDGGNRLVSLLDDRTWEALSQLPAPEALAVIDQVVENMKRQELRNPNAFFMSCARRYLEKQRTGVDPGPGPHQPAPGSYSNPGPSPRSYSQHPTAPAYTQRGPGDGGRGGPPAPRLSSGSGPGGSIGSLPDVLQRLAVQAVSRHHPMLTESMFDEGVVEYMKRLSEEDAVGVFEELLAADLSNVRNVPAYLMGMIRKRRQEGPATRR